MDGGPRAAEDSPQQHPSPYSDGLARDANKGDEQQQQQRHTIRWERFLPRRSLRVLLVEHDDSTRHIVTALLRKCSYHVAGVADGLKAWELLIGKQYKFDLVLTEVEMPLLSGIGLLSKIMACEMSKNIPVIMMSSHDSVNVVYKCMLKGAADFLVKPVRRNELRNLWQHVWRKHCSTSYAQGQESINNNTVKSADMSGNNAASNHISAAAGGMSENKERCDEGSDTESSGCKPEGEIQSGERQRGSNKAELINSSTAVESKIEDDNHKMTQETESIKHNSRDENHNIMEIRKEDNAKEKPGEQDLVDRAAERKFGNKDIIDTPRAPETFDSNLQVNGSSQVIDFLGTLANGQCSHAVLEKNRGREEYQFEAKKSLYRANGSTSDALFSWELSLRGPHLDSHTKGDSQERHTLKHSAASAFTRYCTGVPFASQKSDSSPTVLTVTRNTQSDKVESQINGHVAGKEELPQPTTRQENEVGEINDPRAFSAGNHEDESRFTADPCREDAYEPHTPTESNGKDRNMNYPSCQLGGVVQHLFPVGGVPFQSLCTGYGTYVQQVFYHDSSSVHGSHGAEKEQPSRPVDLGHPVVYNLPTSMLRKEGPRSSPLEGIKDTRDNEEVGPRSSICADASQTNVCSELGPRSLMCSNPEQTNRNCAWSLNIINCGGRNENGETSATVGRGMVTENGFEIALQNHDRKELNRDASRREAALVKFRLKRKDRCFEKKVRYHSRKKLAEQRPRIKGQFVRHAAVESNAVTTEEDD